MNEQEKINVALLVHTCDRYAFLYEGFEYFFNKYWDFSIKCNYYFATENLDVEIKGFTNIKSGSGEWADRLKKLLKVDIKEQYVLYFQEDMWLTAPVNAKFFNEIFAVAVSEKLMQVKLHSAGIYKTLPSPRFIEGFCFAKLDNIQSEYLMSHQISLWDKDFYAAQLHKGEHPWRNERKGTKRLKKINPDIFHLDYFSENGHAEININSNPVLRSGYRTVSVNSVLNSNVEGFIEELNNGDDNARLYAQKLKYNYQNNLTHDGKTKPRKEDIFKKIKNFLKGK
jgi:hypothetical protein